MPELQLYLPLWAYLTLYCTALGLLLSIPNLRGKAWLVGFLVIHCVTLILSYLPIYLFHNSTTSSDQYQAYYISWGLINQLLEIVSFALVVAFVLALKSTGETPLAQMLLSFQGRAKRQFFWMVTVTLLVVNIFALNLFFATGLNNEKSKALSGGAGVVIAVICLSLWFFISTWISLATQVKRWHDLDKSGWWVLIGLIPIIGGIWALIETGFFAGKAEANRFDPPPLSDPLVQGNAPAALNFP